MALDVNKGIDVCERLLAEQTSEKKRRNLELVIAHMRAEARCDIKGVLATLCDKPRYVWHSEPDNPDLNPQGSKQAVAGFYDRMVVQPGAHRLGWDITRVMVDDDAVLTEGVMKVAFPGKGLLEMGVNVDDPDAYYVAEGITTVIWPVDPESGLLVGEEVYEYDKMNGIEDRKISLDEIVPLMEQASAG
jgi:hypothetical protein